MRRELIESYYEEYQRELERFLELFQRKMQWRELWQKKCISGDFWIMKDWCVKKTVRSE